MSNKIYSPVILDEITTYVIGLIHFMTFNTNPNIDVEHELPQGT